MRPSHRLDVLAVPSDPGTAPVEAMRALFAELVAEEVVDPAGRPGRRAAAWMPEGFAGLRLDVPSRMVLYANRQGGFRVHCPRDGSVITAAFAAAWGQARGLERPDVETFVCPACGQVHTLAETVGRPAFRFAQLSLQTIDAEALYPAAGAVHRLEAIFGGVAFVGVRT